MFTEVGAEVDNENDADLDDEFDEDQVTEWTKSDISLAVENLKNLNRKPNRNNNAAHAREAALLGYFRLLKIGKTKKAASSFISDSAGRGVYFSRSIRTRARTSMNDGPLPHSKQRKHAKRSSFLQDEDCIITLQKYLRANKFNAEIATLKKYTNEDISPS